MKILCLLMVCLLLPLTGCTLFEKKDTDKKITGLDKRVSSVEERQTALEDRLGEGEEVAYTTNIEPKKKTPEVSGKVSMSKKEIQTALKNAGYYYGPIDGKIGRMSKQAIKEFQEDHDLKVDGVVGAKTTKKLFTYLSEELK